MQPIDVHGPEYPIMPRESGFSRLVALASLCVLVAAACHHGDDGGHVEPMDCSTETRADTYIANLSKTGSNGFALLLVEGQPAPPAKGDNTWTVQLLDDAGAPVDGATLNAVPSMPDHGHGTPIVAETTPAGQDGRYQIAPVNLWMPGLWEVTVDIEVGGAADQVTYAFCIDG